MALWLGLSAWGAPAHAQTPPRVTLALRGVPLRDALADLVGRAQLDLTYTPELVAGRTSYCVTRDALPEEALRCVLGGTGLDFYRLSSGMYVLTVAARTPGARGALQGFVLDAETGAALARASVVLTDGLTGTATDATGRFAFERLAPRTYLLRASFVGYRPHTDTVRVAPAGVTRHTVALERAPAPILPLLVDGMAVPRTAARAGADLDLAASPFGAGRDVAGQMAQLPGVTIGNVTADVHVQGGDAGEHDLRLDGVPVFTPPVLLHLVGPFSPYAIGQINVEKAGFGAQPGSNTVGIIEASQTLGAQAPARLDAQIDALSASLRAMGRHRVGRGGTGRWMAAARHDLWDHYRLSAAHAYLRQINREDTFLRALFSAPPPASANADPLRPLLGTPSTGSTPSISFQDAHAAYQVRPTPLHTLGASGYLGVRSMRTNAPAPATDNFEWTTYAGQMHYEAVLSSRFLARLQVRTSRYELQHFYGLAYAPGTGGARGVEDFNIITETAAELQVDYTPTPRLLVEWGVSPIVTRDDFSVLNVQGSTVRHKTQMERVAAYLTARAQPFASFQAELGFRATYVDNRGRVYPEPRLSLRYDSPAGRLGQVSMRVGAGLYEQFVGQYQISSPAPNALLSTSRVWMALDPSVEPSRAEHYSAELSYRPGRGWGLDLEGYYKHQLRLYTVDYASLGTSDGLAPQASFLTGGEGYAWGAGATLEKRWGNNRLSITGQRAHTERSTALFDFAYYVVPWNEPWHLSATADLNLTRQIVVIGRWQSVWGRSWAFRQAYYDYLTASEGTASLPPAIREVMERHVRAYRLDAPESNTLPPYHRLDLGLAYTVHLGWTRVQYRLDALNVLDADNVAERRLVGDPAYYDATGLLRADDRLDLPFTLVWAVRLTL